MKRIYSYYGKGDLDSRPVLFEFPPPFEDNMNRDMQQRWGAFLKLIDHKRKVVKLHSEYDSGKGWQIIPPDPRRPPLPILLKKALATTDNIIVLKGTKFDIVLNVGYNRIMVYRDGHVDLERKEVSGYTEGGISKMGDTDLVKRLYRAVNRIRGFKFVSLETMLLDD